MRRAFIIVMLALGMALAISATPKLRSLAASARTIQRNFQQLKQADSLSTIERFFFSIVLAKTEAVKSEAPRPGVIVWHAEGPRT